MKDMKTKMENKFLRYKLESLRNRDKELNKISDDLQDKFKANYELKIEVIKEIIQREEIFSQTEWEVRGSSANYVYLYPKNRMSELIDLLYKTFQYDENLDITDDIRMSWHDSDLYISVMIKDLFFFVKGYGLVVDYSKFEKQKSDLVKQISNIDEFLVKITSPSWESK